jgi:hypothetical protein
MRAIAPGAEELPLRRLRGWWKGGDSVQDEARIRDHLGEMVRGTVEEALNAMLDAEADRRLRRRALRAQAEPEGTRAGRYKRSLETPASQVSLKVPKLRRQTLGATSIEHNRRREIGREGARRDASPRRLGSPGRGHHSNALGARR